MTHQLSYYFLRAAQNHLSEANSFLGRGPHQPGGGVDPDASDQDIANHAAIVELTTALEYFENWAVELSVALEDAGVVTLLPEEP